MPKYYVQSGQIKHIIQRDTHYDAIVSVLRIYRGKGLVTSIKICVSETGWKKKLTCYDTDTFLKEIL